MAASAHRKKRGQLRVELAVVAVAALAAGGLVFASLAARAAASQTWTGDGDGTTWGDAQNWAAKTVPGNGDSVTIAPTASQLRPAVTGMPGGIALKDLTLTDASLSGGAVTVTGDFSWSVSQSFNTLAAPLTVQGAASFSGAGEEDLQDPMTFEGDTDIAGPGLRSIQDPGTAITNSGTMTLEPGAVVRATVCCATTDEFLNTGTVTVPTSASGTASIAFMRFDDHGSVSVGAGSVLDVPGGPGEFKAGAGVSGGGTLQFDQGAAITLAANVAITAGTTMVLTGNAEFFGPGSFTGAGRFSWTGGTVDGSLAVASTIHTTISGTARKILMSAAKTRALLAFHGPVTVKDAGLLEAESADISSSGTFTVMPGATVGAGECCVTPDKFTSTGTLTVPASAGGTATLAWMSFRDQGPVSVGPGSTLLVTVGPGSFSSGDHVSGGGTLKFDDDAQMNLASNVSIGAGTTVVLGGESTFAGSGSLIGTGKFQWTGGTVDGNLDVGTGIGTTISGTSAKSLTSPGKTPTALTLRGATTLQGTGEVDLSGATTLSNLGTMTMRGGTTVGASVCCVAPDRFSNGGILDVAAGPGTATVTNMAFVNSGTVKIASGTLHIGTLGYRQSAGVTRLAGGSLSADRQVDIAGGTLTGFGTITGSVLNGGVVSPSTTGGVLKISGAYTQTRLGELVSVITGIKPGARFGQLQVGGRAILAGTLHAVTGNGFTPKHKQAFAVLVCRSRAGTFTRKSGHPAFNLTYSATTAKVVYP